MRVVINQLASLGQKTGIGHYTAELLRCLREQALDDEIDDYPTGWLRRAGRTFKKVASGQWSVASKKEVPFSTLATSHWPLATSFFRISANWGRAWAAHHFRLVCRQRRYDLYHEPNFIPFPCDCPTVVTIPDLSVLLHPEWHPADRVAYFEKNFRRGLAQGTHFLAISEFCRQEIIRTLNIAPTRVTRTYMGIRRGLSPLSASEVAPILGRLGLPSQYLLYLGTIEPRKNLLLLLKAYCDLPEKLRSDWPLLLVGGWGWNTQDIAEYFYKIARHRGVIHLGYVKDRYLAALYNGARALLYPSLYEGFGLPPLEMMACGGPVIASNTAAIAETVGGKAQLLDPNDLDAWRQAMAAVITDENWWQFLRQGVPEVARPYTWDRCAAETLAVYRSVARTEHPQAAA